jgi:hypothetical protein
MTLLVILRALSAREISARALWSSSRESGIAADAMNDTQLCDRVTWDLGKWPATNNSNAGLGSPEFSEAEPLLDSLVQKLVLYTGKCEERG